MARKFLVLISCMLSLGSLQAQTKTTEALHKKHDGALSLYFYKNTLRMLNQSENKDFDDAVKEIEKMKFLMIDKTEEFTSNDYQELLGGYRAENYEEIMTSRYQGKNLDVYLREENNVTKGMIILVNDSTNLFLLDMLGRVPLDKISKLLSALDDNAEIGKKIKSFTDKMDDREERVRHKIN